MNKKDIRKEVKIRFAEAGEKCIKELSNILTDKILSDERYKNAQYVLLYSSLKDEVSTDRLIEASIKTKKVVLPCIEEGNDDLVLRIYKDTSELKKGKYGIYEPTGIIVDPQSIDFALIPGVAFTLDGNRLGRGRGFYDRLLTKITCPTVSVAMPWQICDEIPVDYWDKKIDSVLTVNS